MGVFLPSAAPLRAPRVPPAAKMLHAIGPLALAEVAARWEGNWIDKDGLVVGIGLARALRHAAPDLDLLLYPYQ